MVLPIDAIVPIYYSGSVNPASTNNQTHPVMQNLLVHTEQERVIKNFDKRILQHLDMIFGVPAGLSEQLILSETVIIRKVIPHIAETLTLSESILRKVIPKISETLHLVESILRKPIPKIAEVLSLAESIARKVVRQAANIFPHWRN